MGCDSYIYVEIKSKEDGNWYKADYKIHIPRYVFTEIAYLQSHFTCLSWEEFVALNPSTEIYNLVNIQVDVLPYFLQVSPSLRIFVVTIC